MSVPRPIERFHVNRQLEPPGERYGADVRAVARADAKNGLLDGYLKEPKEDRIGIACSGGGIRSAAFCLGALQVLRSKGILKDAEQLACVSGGGYIAIAHAILVSETIGRAEGDTATAESQLFEDVSPWALGSPEEQHLRSHLKYLAPGFQGWVWMVSNLIYGTVRHLLPFLAVIYLSGFVTGIVMHPWLGQDLPACTGPDCPPNPNLSPFLAGAALLTLAAGVLLIVRQSGLTRKKESSERSMLGLQVATLLVLALAAATLLFGVLVPVALLWLGQGVLKNNPGVVFRQFVLVGGVTTITSIVAFVARNKRSWWFKILLAVVVALSAPIVVLVPYLGFTYWNAEYGLQATQWGRFVLAGVALIMLGVFTWTDEVTSVCHLFYRERLAKAFVGYRKLANDEAPLLKYKQPPWKHRIRFSGVNFGSSDHARLPNLVVCAAANLSRDLPAGRFGASFTFEKDRCGGPSTGYVPTSWFEEEAGEATSTLPALMAVSGAAIAPSMGKMTRPFLRFLMAMFNLRLGVWLPNPRQAEHEGSKIALSAADLREGRKFDTEGGGSVAPGFRRPGALYILREALGINGLDRSFVYVTDGGHWENLGLVELLRRGCGTIVCIDGSGGDAVSFGTLSEAIALARSDLGVEIDIDLTSMVPSEPDGTSASGYVVGKIRFPDENNWKGTLVYIRTVIPHDAPTDVRNFAKQDRTFPNHPTTDQFFDDRKFEAYRALGDFNTRKAIPTLRTLTQQRAHVAAARE